MAARDYLMYHNPDTVGVGCDEVAASGTVATNKEGVANQIAAEGGVIWCVGRTCDDDSVYYLYQRIDQPLPGRGDSEFAVYLTGTPTFPEGVMIDITREPYFPEVKKLLRFGVQPIDSASVIIGFAAAFTLAWRRA